MSKPKNKAGASGSGLEGVSTEELKEGLAALMGNLEMMLPNAKSALSLSDEDWEYLQRAVVRSGVYGDVDGINAGGAINAALSFVGLLPGEERSLEQDIQSLPRSPDDMISDLLGLSEAEREKARSMAGSEGQTIAASLRQFMQDVGMI